MRSVESKKQFQQVTKAKKNNDIRMMFIAIL
jgi:hypothetical protein